MTSLHRPCGAMARTLTFLCYLFVLSHSLDAYVLPGEDKESEKSARYVDNPTLHPFAGTRLKIDSLQTQLYCGHQDLSSVPQCIHYSYKSNALIETFLVNKDTYTILQEQGEALKSDGVILEGSYCLGKDCETTADLHGVQHWCLMFMNIDPTMATASVSFEYQVCVEKDDQKDLILILTITCVGLLLVAFLACLGCCWMLRRRKRDSSVPRNVSKEETLQHLSVPLLPPPPPLNRYGTDILVPHPHPPPPMVSHAPYRHEPAFQIQPPLPLSHPPPTTSSAPPQAPGQEEVRVQFRTPERKRRSKSASKIRFPI